MDRCRHVLVGRANAQAYYSDARAKLKRLSEEPTGVGPGLSGAKDER